MGTRGTGYVGWVSLIFHILKRKLLIVQDLMIVPYNVNTKSCTRKTYKQIKSNLTSTFKNAATCVSGSFIFISKTFFTFVRVDYQLLASANSIPGVFTLYRKSLVQIIRDVKQISRIQFCQARFVGCAFPTNGTWLLYAYEWTQLPSLLFFVLFHLVFLIVYNLPLGETRRILL